MNHKLLAGIAFVLTLSGCQNENSIGTVLPVNTTHKLFFARSANSDLLENLKTRQVTQHNKPIYVGRTVLDKSSYKVQIYNGADLVADSNTSDFELIIERDSVKDVNCIKSLLLFFPEKNPDANPEYQVTYKIQSDQIFGNEAFHEIAISGIFTNHSFPDHVQSYICLDKKVSMEGSSASLSTIYTGDHRAETSISIHLDGE